MNDSSVKLGLILRFDKINVTCIYLYYLLSFPADIGRKPASPACGSR